MGEREAPLLPASVLQRHQPGQECGQVQRRTPSDKGELESGKPVAEHQKAYDDFFIQNTTSKRGLQVSFNSEAVNQHISRYAGFQALLSNGIKDPVGAMQVYRDKAASGKVLRRPEKFSRHEAAADAHVGDRGWKAFRAVHSFDSHQRDTQRIAFFETHRKIHGTRNAAEDKDVDQD
jgi:hypothetical protein